MILNLKIDVLDEDATLNNLKTWFNEFNRNDYVRIKNLRLNGYDKDAKGMEIAFNNANVIKITAENSKPVMECRYKEVTQSEIKQNLEFDLLDGMLLHVALTNLNPKMVHTYYSGLDNPDEELFNKAFINFADIREDLIDRLHDSLIEAVNPLEIEYIADCFRGSHDI